MDKYILYDSINTDNLMEQIRNKADEIFDNREDSIRKMSARQKGLYKSNTGTDPFLENFPCTIEEEIIFDNVKYKVVMDIEAEYVLTLPEEAVNSIYGTSN